MQIRGPMFPLQRRCFRFACEPAAHAVWKGGLDMVHIVTDTTSGLAPDVAAQYDIPVIPQIIHFGEDSFRECVDMDSKMFMERLLRSETLPMTAAPSPEWFHEHLLRFSQDGEPILCIHPSSKVSGTVRSALVARQAFPGVDIRVLDTKAVGAPLGQMVTQAAKWASQGVDADTISARLEDMTARLHIYFTVDTLEYLQRGGRIGGARALLGNLLRIRPILTWKEGQVEPLVNERTRKRALNRILQLARDEAPRDRDPLFSVMHAAAPDVAAQMVDQLHAEFGQVEVMVMDLVPAIVTHAGPGAIALGYFV
jgi:fatty acid kinase fatty acid binding subunit